MRSTLLLTAALLAACGAESAAPDAGFAGPPRILDFTASATEISVDGVVDLSWRVEDARTIAVEAPWGTIVSSFQGEGAVSTLPLRMPASFVLTAENPIDTVTASVAVHVEWPPPMIVSFRRPSPQMQIGSFDAFEWFVTGAERVQLLRDGMLLASQNVPPSGAQGTFGFQIDREEAVYRLEAHNPQYSTARDVTVIGGMAPLIEHLAVVPRSFVGRVETATVSWIVHHATSVALYLNDLPAQVAPSTLAGEHAFRLGGPTRIRLEASNERFVIAGEVFVHDPAREQEPNNFQSQATDITWAGAVTGVLGNANDVDNFLYRATPGRSVRATTAGPTGMGCEADTRLLLITGADDVLARATDGGAEAPGGGACAVAEIEAPAAPIFIEVHDEGGRGGAYMLIVDEL